MEGFELIWEGYSFDLYPDGSYVEKATSGDKITFLKIQKGRFISIMKSVVLFYEYDSGEESTIWQPVEIDLIHIFPKKPDA